MSTTSILVAYFSRADENWGVGKITKGNTKCLAEVIASKTGADLFEIKTIKSYPVGYDECTVVAKKELHDNIRPEITATVPNMDQYSTIFVGYPAWWGDAPMAVYTFLEGYDLSGKTIIPFSTHEGSGMTGEEHIAKVCSKSTVKEGLAVTGQTAQKNAAKTEKAVDAWLAKIGMK